MADCSNLSTTAVLLVWKDNEIENNKDYVFCCNGQSRVVYEYEITGDGTSELAIILRNESSSEEYMTGIVKVWEV